MSNMINNKTRKSDHKSHISKTNKNYTSETTFNTSYLPFKESSEICSTSFTFKESSEICSTSITFKESSEICSTSLSQVNHIAPTQCEFEEGFCITQITAELGLFLTNVCSCRITSIHKPLIKINVSSATILNYINELPLPEFNKMIIKYRQHNPSFIDNKSNLLCENDGFCKKQGCDDYHVFTSLENPKLFSIQNAEVYTHYVPLMTQTFFNQLLTKSKPSSPHCFYSNECFRSIFGCCPDKSSHGKLGNTSYISISSFIATANDVDGKRFVSFHRKIYPKYHHGYGVCRSDGYCFPKGYLCDRYHCLDNGVPVSQLIKNEITISDKHLRGFLRIINETPHIFTPGVKLGFRAKEICGIECLCENPIVLQRHPVKVRYDFKIPKEIKHYKTYSAKDYDDIANDPNSKFPIPLNLFPLKTQIPRQYQIPIMCEYELDPNFYLENGQACAKYYLGICPYTKHAITPMTFTGHHPSYHEIMSFLSDCSEAEIKTNYLFYWLCVFSETIPRIEAEWKTWDEKEINKTSFLSNLSLSALDRNIINKILEASVALIKSNVLAPKWQDFTDDNLPRISIDPQFNPNCQKARTTFPISEMACPFDNTCSSFTCMNFHTEGYDSAMYYCDKYYCPGISCKKYHTYCPFPSKSECNEKRIELCNKYGLDLNQYPCAQFHSYSGIIDEKYQQKKSAQLKIFKVFFNDLIQIAKLEPTASFDILIQNMIKIAINYTIKTEDLINLIINSDYYVNATLKSKLMCFLDKYKMAKERLVNDNVSFRLKPILKRETEELIKLEGFISLFKIDCVDVSSFLDIDNTILLDCKFAVRDLPLISKYISTFLDRANCATNYLLHEKLQQPDFYLNLLNEHYPIASTIDTITKYFEIITKGDGVTPILTDKRVIKAINAINLNNKGYWNDSPLLGLSTFLQELSLKMSRYDENADTSSNLPKLNKLGNIIIEYLRCIKKWRTALKDSLNKNSNIIREFYPKGNRSLGVIRLKQNDQSLAQYLNNVTDPWYGL